MINAELEEHLWLVGNEPSIADLANYTYVAHAPEGEISLERNLNIHRWHSRIEALPGFAPMIKQVCFAGLTTDECCAETRQNWAASSYRKVIDWWAQCKTDLINFQ